MQQHQAHQLQQRSGRGRGTGASAAATAAAGWVGSNRSYSSYNNSSVSSDWGDHESTQYLDNMAASTTRSNSGSVGARGRGRGRGVGRGGSTGGGQQRVVDTVPGSLGTAIYYFSRLLRDDDPNFSKRVQLVSQLSAYLAVGNIPLGSELSDPRSLQYLLSSQQHIIDVCLSDSRAVPAFKQSISSALVNIGLAFQADCAPFFSFIFEWLHSLNQVQSDQPHRELKQALLSVLRQVVSNSVVPYAGNQLWTHNFIAQVIRDTQAFIDGIEGPEYLPRTLDLVHAIAQRYPDAFKMAFKEFFVVLVGWMIDPSLPKNIHQAMTESFKSIWRIWRERLRFGLDLIKNLSTDLEVEAQSILFNSDHDPDQYLAQQSQHQSSSAIAQRAQVISPKMRSLLRCVFAVTQAICFACFQSINPEAGSGVLDSNPFFVKELTLVLTKILSCVYRVAKETHDRQWHKQGMDLVVVLSRSLKSKCSSNLQELVLEFVFVDVQSPDAVPSEDMPERIKEVLQFLNELAVSWMPNFPSNLPAMLISPLSSPLIKIAHSKLPADSLHQLLLRTLKIVDVVSSSDNVAATETVAFPANVDIGFLHHILDLVDKLKSRYRVRRLASTSSPPLYRTMLLNEETITGCDEAVIAAEHLQKSDSKTLESVLDFDLNILSALEKKNLRTYSMREGLVGNDRAGGESDAVVVSAQRVVRILLSLVSVSADGESPRLWGQLWWLTMERKVLGMVYEIAKRHSMFVGGDDERDVFNAVTLAVRGLVLQNGDRGKRLLGMAWFRDILISVSLEGDESHKEICENILVSLLLCIGMEHNARTRELVGELWFMYSNCCGFSDTFFAGETQAVSALRAICLRLDDVDLDVRSAFSSVVYSLDPLFIVAAMSASSPVASDVVSRSRIMSSPSSGTVLPRHFLTLYQCLFQLGPAPEDIHQSHQIMSDIFFFCQGLKHHNSEQTKVWCDFSLSLSKIRYWAIWELARFCISSSFKTYFGSTTQTLETFKALLSRSAQASTSLDSSVNQKEIIRNVVDFFDALETQFLSSTKGPSSFIHQVPEPASLFLMNHLVAFNDFWQNSRFHIVVCCSFLCIRDEILVRNASDYLRVVSLQYLKGSISDAVGWKDRIDSVVTSLVSAYVRLSSSSNITGLDAWFKKAFIKPHEIKESVEKKKVLLKKKSEDSGIKPISYPWLPSLALMASKNFDGAAKEMNASFIEARKSKSPFSPVIFKFLKEKVTACYLMVNDIDGLMEFQSLLESTDPDRDYDVVKSNLSSWLDDESELESSAQHDVWKLICRIHTPCLELPRTSHLSLSMERLCADVEFVAANTCDIMSLLQLNSLAAPKGHARRLPLPLLSSLIDQKKNFVEAMWILDREVRASNGSSPETKLLQSKLLRKHSNFESSHRILRNNPCVMQAVGGDLHRAKLDFLKSGNRSELEALLERPISGVVNDCDLKARAAIYLTRTGFSSTSSDEIINNQLVIASLDSCSSVSLKAHQSLADWYYQEALMSAEQLAKAAIDGVCPFRLHVDTTLIEAGILKDFANAALVEDHGVWGFSSQREISVESLLMKLATTYTHCDKLESAVQSLFKFWDRALFCIQSAIKSYFARLCDIQAPQDFPKSGTKASLRLLQLLVSYGAIFEDLFENGFKTCSLQPWISVIPQLFARLSHPDKNIRSILTRFILRVGQSNPLAILFPVVVGSRSEKLGPNQHLLDSYRQLLALMKQDVLAMEIGYMVSEFQRITLLWEEKWFYKLGQMQHDLRRRFARIRSEVKRIMESPDALTEKETCCRDVYYTLMSPVIEGLRKLESETVGSPGSTPHEIKFKTHYGLRINQAFESLENDKNYENVKQGWTLFEKIFFSISKDLHKSRSVALTDVSPFLANLSGSQVPIPGSNPLNAVTISGLSDRIYILPTKTKPKKVELRGSDGLRYTFLFKGLEDLHLDEGVQQFISGVNGYLRASDASLCARTYTVIPFGDKFGMIQWVDNAKQLFSFYKRFLQRSHTAKMTSRKDSTSETSIQPVKPHELFQSKVLLALKRRSLSRKTPREVWPPELLKEVLVELKNESPSDLLSSEMIMSSPSPKLWWDKVNAYCRSLATTSIIGHILGLGDRHLDNILLDSATGEIVHIDYNVCFEKGLKLRIPETVPFRLTQNLVDPLGITGVDGVFRSSCESVLSIMRRNSDTLITLLSAFIYNPLSDWGYCLPEDLSQRFSEVNADVRLLQLRLGPVKTRMDALLGSLQSSLELVSQHVNIHLSSIAGDSLKLSEKIRAVLNERILPTIEKGKGELRGLHHYMDVIYRRCHLIADAAELIKIMKMFWNSWPKLGEDLTALIKTLEEDLGNGSGVKDADEIKTKISKLESMHRRRSHQFLESAQSLLKYPKLTVVKSFYSTATNDDTTLKEGDLSSDLERFGYEDEGEETEIDGNASEADDNNDEEEEEDADEDALSQKSKQSNRSSSSDQAGGQDKLIKLDNATDGVHFAVDAVNRVKHKLQGKFVFGEDGIMTVRDQVEAVLQQAQSNDNLAKMYEGWMAWI